MQQEDTNNNPMKDSITDLTDPALASQTSLSLPALQSQPTAAASVADFYRRLQKSQGRVLDSLHSGDTCLAEDFKIKDYAPILASLADEQKFEVKFLALESLEGAWGGKEPGCFLIYSTHRWVPWAPWALGKHEFLALKLINL